MAKADYEKMLKRIEKNLVKHSKVTDADLNFLQLM